MYHLELHNYERLNELLEQVVSYAFNDFPFRLKKKQLIILFYNALLCEEPCSRIQVVRLENFSGQTKINIFLPGLVLDCFCSVVPHTEYVIDMS